PHAQLVALSLHDALPICEPALDRGGGRLPQARRHLPRPAEGAVPEAVASSMALLELRNITKDFPGVRALDGVSFTLEKGEIHALDRKSTRLNSSHQIISY